MRNYFILLLSITLLGFSKEPIRPINKYPQDYFRSPIDQAIRLSGTFGELRSNHLHSGIDIKAANGKTGQAIYAAADGKVCKRRFVSWS